MKNLIVIAVIAFLFQACGSDSNQFTIEGEFKNASGEEVSLVELKSEGLNKVDSVKLEEDGMFKFTGYTNIPKFFVIQTDGNRAVTLIVSPDDDIELTADLNDFHSTYELEGSEDSKEIMKLRSRLENTISRLDSLGKVYKENAGQDNMEELRNRLNKESRKIVEKHKGYTKEFIDNHLNSLASLMALYQQIGPRSYVLDPQEDFNYYKKVDSALMAHYPNSDPVQSLHSQVNELKNYMAQQKTAEDKLAPGIVAPNITLPNPQGDTVALHSLRGKYVLLDFWASWCKPCRVENPHLVKAYNKYKDQGFEIYQVSLDKKRNAWLEAIEKDNLDWVHVSDLEFWNSKAAKKYNIRSIPANFLLNKKGEIIAKDLRGDALDQKLNEIFNK